MFDFERAIAEWREQMLTAGIKTPVPLEELENHLREEIRSQIALGMEIQKAFEHAVRQIGEPAIVEAEFRKAAYDQVAREQKWMGVYCIAFPIFYFFLVLRALLKMEMSFNERTFGLVALALTCASIWSTQYYHKYLPAIPDKRRRLGLYLACLFSWMLCGGVFMNCVLPHLNLTASQLTVTMLWLMMPVAVISGLGYGLNEATRRHTARETT